MLRLSKLRAMAIAVMATSGGGYSTVPAVGVPPGPAPLRLLSSFLKVALLGFPDEGRYRVFFGERHDLSWAQLVSIPAVPHAYRDVTSCRVILLCIAACGMEPPWAFGP